MEEIKAIFEAYLKEQDEGKGYSLGRELNKKLFSELSEMLVDSCYLQVESDINHYVTYTEEQAFTEGFKAAMRLMAQCANS